ncbi:hypothetical protein [Paracoccus actinidiae]|uniref:hypothetical protein n=1 Tax=Paracoccus actinidiae TaxID=3064531 RepID=UPI0027D1E9E5|nr:hypothetical protein [Paracoccus sp. M09]
MAAITQEKGFAQDRADRVPLLKGGMIVEQGSPDFFLRMPQRPRTQISCAG